MCPVAEMVDPCRIVIADDHPVFRSGMLFLLEQEPGIEIAGQAVNGNQALSLVAELRPDLLILDLMLPGLSGLAVLERLMRASTRPRVLVISGSVSGQVFKQVLDIGADGVLSKEERPDQLIDAITALRADRRFVSPLVAGIIGHLTESRAPDAAEHLTTRERQVLALVAEGHSNEAIGAELGISPRTAKKHRENIRAKLGISTAVEATHVAVRLGLVKLS